MESKAKLAGHPIHQMLIVFPLGLLATSVVFDLIGAWLSRPQWYEASFFMIGAGVIGGLCAAIFGLIDWTAIPSATRAKTIGAWHGLGNVLVVLLFAASWILRWNSMDSIPDSSAMILSWSGVVVALITGWLGGELINRMGVGIDDGANLNAPSSLQWKSTHHSGLEGGR